MTIFDTTNLSSLRKAVEYLQKTTPKGIIYLHGDLGVGKTTFVQFWLYCAGYADQVVSPTYSLVNEYKVDDITFIHTDLYRLNNPDELIYLDVEEWQNRADFIFVEWSENGGDFLPAPDYHAFIALTDGKRTVKWMNDK